MREIANRFAERGRVWKTTVAAVGDVGARHLGRLELIDLLQGKGKGKARWKNPFEVLQARRYVEQNAEHLLDFSPFGDASESDIEAAVTRIFDKA